MAHAALRIRLSFNYHKLINAQGLQAPGLNQIAGATMGHRTIPQAYIHTIEMLLDHSVNPLGKCNTIMYHSSLVATLICVRIAPTVCISINHPNCVKTNQKHQIQWSIIVSYYFSHRLIRYSWYQAFLMITKQEPVSDLYLYAILHLTVMNTLFHIIRTTINQ